MQPDLPRTGADFDRLRLALALFQVIEVGAEELDGAVIDDDDVRSWRGVRVLAGIYVCESDERGCPCLGLRRYEFKTYFCALD